jgi:hypothetical protein
MPGMINWTYRVSCKHTRVVRVLLVQGFCDSEWVKRQVWCFAAAVPDILIELLRDPNPQETKRVNTAMLGMIKLDIPGLMRAYSGVWGDFASDLAIQESETGIQKKAE